MDFFFFKEALLSFEGTNKNWCNMYGIIKAAVIFTFQKPFKFMSSLVNCFTVLTSNFHKALLRAVNFIFFSLFLL